MEPTSIQEPQTRQPIQETQSRPTLYNPAETDRIVRALKEGAFYPEYILLFGSLAGGTPHSEATAYDLLLVVRHPNDYTGAHARRYLNGKFPQRHREIPYVNIYVATLDELETRRVPFLHFALTEGILLYQREGFCFERPRRSHNFRAAYCDAKLYCDMFHRLGKRFLELARKEMVYREDHRIRLAAHALAQAAVLFYKVLYYAYHNRETESNDPVLLHERVRTLSTELMLLCDDTHVDHITTIPRLKSFGERACSDPKFTVNPFVLEQDFERVTKIEEIVARKCRERLQLYEDRAAK